MALYIYCNFRSDGARELTQAIGAHRIRFFDGLDFWQKHKRIKLKEGDQLICWGHPVPPLEGIKVLNPQHSIERLDKEDEANALHSSRVPTVYISGRVVDLTSGDQIVYLPRRSNHVGGSDLLNPGKADYWVKKEVISKEYRIHSFEGRSIRAGIKQPREGFRLVDASEWKPNSNLVHPWIRSFDGGWRINYTGFKSTPMLKKLASQACKALRLDFGAVDIGERPDGTVFVLEVNKAPGIEGGTLEAYSRAIKRWVTGEVVKPTRSRLSPV